MPIPDNTFFGHKPEGGTIKYGEARTITDEQKKLQVLKARLDPILIWQINQLTVFDDEGVRKIYSPFPLTVLTLLSIETLGHVIGNLEKIKEENDYEQSKAIVTPIYSLMDKKLSHKPTKAFYKSFKKYHGKDDKKSIKHYSDIIHKYQRNTFNHGYQSRGVLLTEETSEAFHIAEDVGCLYVNPYNFWDLFKKTYDNIFNEILVNKNSEYRKNALNYFNRLIQ